MTATLDMPVLRRPHARKPRLYAVAEPVEPEVYDDGIENTAKALAVACVEVMQGRRSAATLIRWATPQLLERIRAFAQVKSELVKTRPQALTRIHAGHTRVCHVNSSTVEATVNVISKDRHRAVALRLTSSAGRWFLSELLVI